MDRLLRLFPGPPEPAELRGLYLSHRLHEMGTVESPFVYGSFVSSLDGRIALGGAEAGYLPDGLTSTADFRLLCELIAQADCLITHGGYFRAVRTGRLDDILQIGRLPATSDLRGWRQAAGLMPQPAIAVASASLDFEIPPSLARNGQSVIVVTGSDAPRHRVEALRGEGAEVVVLPAPGLVQGGALVSILGERGYRSLYLLAGPRMLGTMVRDRRLSRLYLTIVHRLIGGEAYHTMVDSPVLGPAGKLTLSALYQDSGQWFAEFGR